MHRIIPMHEGRVGNKIIPQAIVWHYTAMLPSTEVSLAKVWSQSKGKGNGAHAIIRRNGEVLCLSDFLHNGNHAGGPTSGAVRLRKGTYGANTVAVGIELSNPGRVRRWHDGWRLAYTGNDVTILPKDITVTTDAELDEGTRSPNWGWCNYTEEQVKSAKNIARVCWEMGMVNSPCVVLRRPHPITKKVYPDIIKRTMTLSHSDLDPSRKSDPGPLWNANSVVEVEYGKPYKK
jgi:N-acetyl-anhydromuramyl-L-alanine amidase AmpD